MMPIWQAAEGLTPHKNSQQSNSRANLLPCTVLFGLVLHSRELAVIAARDSEVLGAGWWLPAAKNAT